MEIITMVVLMVYFGIVAIIFFAVQFVIDAIPLLFAIIVALVITAVIFTLLYWIFSPFKRYLLPYKDYIYNAWKIICYIVIFPPVAVILLSIFLLPFMLIVVLTDSLTIGILALLTVVGLILFNRHSLKIIK